VAVGESTCHARAQYFRGILHVWQLWQVVRRQFGARDLTFSPLLLLSFLEKERVNCKNCHWEESTTVFRGLTIAVCPAPICKHLPHPSGNELLPLWGGWTCWTWINEADELR
jgi:hypothetical protein